MMNSDLTSQSCGGGAFTRVLLDGLERGNADVMDGDGYVLQNEIGLYVGLYLPNMIDREYEGLKDEVRPAPQMPVATIYVDRPFRSQRF
jgi:hypothetical protein